MFQALRKTLIPFFSSTFSDFRFCRRLFHGFDCDQSVISLLFQSQKDPMLVEKIMNDLDSNKDNEVDFNEFVVLVAALTVACNDFFQEKQRKNNK